MIDFLINHISLKSRIQAGYIILALAALIITLLSFKTLDRIESEVKQYAGYSESAVANTAFALQMSEIQRQALIYIYEGHASAGERVEDIYFEMTRVLNSAEYPPSHELFQLITSVQTHLNNYINTFKDVRKQRDITEELVRTELRKNANSAQLLLDKLINNSEQGSENQGFLYSRINNSFLQIEKNAYRYFDTLDAQYIDQAAQNIQDTRAQINSIISPQNRELAILDNLIHVLNEYERSFYEAVQRTRGYLFLTNVVMAAEAYETHYQAQKLTAQINQQAHDAKAEIYDDIRTTIQTLMLTCSVLLLLLGLLALLISRSITSPLKKLSTTFEALTQNQLETPIPNYPQRDELGELSSAAQFLKTKSLELNEYKQELERSNEELEQFVYTVSHDLKSPIVTSMGFIGIIQKLAAQGKHEQAWEKLDRVVKSNQRMSQLVNDLLELSRVGRTDLDKQQIDLNELMAQFTLNQAERLKRAEYNLVIETPLPTINANESRVLQVFENLLSNALKYGRNEQGSCIKIGAKDSKNNTLIYFSDNGKGIATEFQEKIFGLFYRLDTEPDGTGIGLAVAKKVMKHHGGDIWVESTPTQGATFWLTFPKQPAQGQNNGSTNDE